MLAVLFFIVVFFGGFIISYIVDTVKGETNLIQKHKQDKLNQSIESKVQSGEELTEEEKEEIERKIKLIKLAHNLQINDYQTKER